MDTVRVNILYRPLRICWAIKEGDHGAFREAVRLNHALWGGRFNPIAVVDRDKEARAIVGAFGADLVQPLGTGEEVKAIAASFKHLISPFLDDTLFVGQADDARAQVLDVHNAIVRSIDEPEWKQLKERKPRIYTWSQDDALADIFLMQLGAYPAKESIHLDYSAMFKNALEAEEVTINAGANLAADIFDHPSIAYLSRHRLQRHYSIRSYRDHHGFFVGDAANLDDLVAFWNLRAADISLLFVDRANAGRYADAIPAWKKYVSAMLSGRRHKEDPNFAIWYRSQDFADAGDAEALRALIGQEPCIISGVDEVSWNGLNIKPPLMHFGDVASLGVLVTERDKPKVSFGLNDRPYATDTWFHTQHLVASVNVLGGLYGREDYTLDPPYVPELNEFYARTMHFRYDRLRIESERIGLVISATDTDSFVYALPTAELFKRVFALAGFTARVSSGGLTRRAMSNRRGSPRRSR